jgi:flagellar motor switch protein FliN
MTNTSLASLPQHIELPELQPTKLGGKTILNSNLDIIKNVRVKIVVRVGETTLSVGELMRMKTSDIFKLDTAVNSPIDMLLDDRVIARGHLVAVDDHFGVQITELPNADKT